MNTLPKDPIILLSYVNTQLRDNYNSLEEMCQALDTDQSNIISVLSGIGYRYEPAQNCGSLSIVGVGFVKIPPQLYEKGSFYV